MRGGKREGAGRTSEGRKYIKLRLSEREYRMIALMGGSKMLQEMVKAIQEKKVAVKIDTSRLTKEEQELFVDGWAAAGGYMGDVDGDNPSPWCCPWATKERIEVTGDDVRYWGAQYWASVKDEINSLLAEEARSAEEEDLA